MEIRDALEGGPGADRYLSNRKTLQRGDPIAPGVQIRVTGGKLQAPTRCGGQVAVTKVRRNMRAYNLCYRAAYQRDPTLKGSVQVAWTLAQDGRAVDIEVTSQEISDKELSACIVNSLDSLSFPAHSASPDDCRLTWVLKMLPRDPANRDEKRKVRELRLKVFLSADTFRMEPSGEGATTRLGEDEWESLKTSFEEESTIHQQMLIRADVDVTTRRLIRTAAVAKAAGFNRIFLAESRK
jgi:hypothetical protein